jgi:hypothetical protein
MYPRWATTKTYSKPLYDLTGKRPVRSADDQSPSALVMVLARDHSVRGGEEALFIADRQVGGSTLAAGGGDAFSEGVQVAEGFGEG